MELVPHDQSQTSVLSDFAIGLVGTEVMGGPSDGQRTPSLIIVQMMLSPLAAQIQGLPHAQRRVELAFSPPAAAALAEALNAAVKEHGDGVPR